MDKVVEYLEAQPDIDKDNIKRFKEEVCEYDQTHPNELIWSKISEYIDKAGSDNDKFLVLLEEDYKDLSTHLFNAQFGLLDDFENSESIAEGSDNGSDKRERSEEMQLQNNTEKTLSYENERKRSDPDATQVNTKKSQNTIEYNIYDDEQDDEDKYASRRRGDSDDEKDKSNND